MSAKEKQPSHMDEERWRQYYLAVVEEGREVMYHVTKSLYKGGSMHPLTYCMNHIKSGRTHYYSTFKKDQLAVLELWATDDPYDITKAASKWDISLHYTFLVNLCDLSILHKGSLKKMLQVIKRHRDSISHGAFFLSQEKMVNHIHELERVYTCILDFVGEKYEVNLENVKNRIITRLYNRLFTTNSKKHVQDDTWDISEAEKCLKALYAPKRQVIPAGIRECKAFPISHLFYTRNVVIGSEESVYTDDHIADESNNTSRSGECVFQKMSQSITCNSEECGFKKMKQSSNNTINVNQVLSFLMENKSAQHLILTGRAGCGKSTFLLHILDQWCAGSTNIDGLSKLDLVFYVDLASIQSSTVISLLQREMLKSLCMKVHVDKILQTLQERNVLWLLDGFDETSKEIRNLTEDIVQKFPLVITSSRKEYLPTLKTYNDGRTITGQFEPLSYKTAKEFACKVVSVIGNQKLQEKFENSFLKKELDRNGLKQCLLSSPLEITQLCFLFVKKYHVFSKIETSSDLLEELLFLRTEELAGRIEKKLSITKGNIMIILSDLLIKVGEVFWQCCLKNVKHLSEWNIKYLFSECEERGFGNVKTELMSTFFEMKDCNSYNILGSTTTYLVSYDSIMQFLASKYLCCKVSNNRGKFIKSLIENPSPCHPQNETISKVLVNFVGVLTKEQNMGWVLLNHVIELLHSLGFSEWLTLINEGKCNSNLSEIVATIKGNQLKITDADLIFWWNPLLSLLQKRKIRFLKLNVESKPSDMNTLIALIRIMCDYVEGICLNCAWTFCDFGASCVNDEILKAVADHKSCFLVCFHGFLSPYAIDTLVPLSVAYLHLRLADLDQLTALKQCLWGRKMKVVNLVLDFPKAFYPGNLCKLDLIIDKDKQEPQEVESNRDSYSIYCESILKTAYNRIRDEPSQCSTEILGVCIPNVDDSHMFWACRMLQNLSDCEYEEVWFQDCQISDDGRKCFQKHCDTLKLEMKKACFQNEGNIVSILIPRMLKSVTITTRISDFYKEVIIGRFIAKLIANKVRTLLVMILILLGLYKFGTLFPEFSYYSVFSFIICLLGLPLVLFPFNVWSFIASRRTT